MHHTDLATSFSGQYFVVTGSTQGLGAAVAIPWLAVVRPG